MQSILDFGTSMFLVISLTLASWFVQVLYITYNLTVCIRQTYHIQGRSEKYLASPPDGATLAREIDYCILHSCRMLLSIQYQSAIQLVFLEEKSRCDIKPCLHAVYSDFSPSMAAYFADLQKTYFSTGYRSWYLSLG